MAVTLYFLQKPNKNIHYKWLTWTCLSSNSKSHEWTGGSWEPFGLFQSENSFLDTAAIASLQKKNIKRTLQNCMVWNETECKISLLTGKKIITDIHHICRVYQKSLADFKIQDKNYMCTTSFVYDNVVWMKMLIESLV